ncbi:MAG: hypothetical protein RIQ60_446 [Pseudomonadota bacterium]|jgi:hypothetical protein
MTSAPLAWLRRSNTRLALIRWCVGTARLRWMVLGLALLGAGLVACSPALDWRDARLGGPVRLLLPCKADRYERRLPLAGGDSQATMLVCDAQGITWSVTRFELNEPTRVGAALAEMRDRLAHNLGAEDAKLPGALPAGATPLDAAGRSRMNGRRPNGDGVLAEALFFGESSRAYQLVALLPAPASAAVLAQTAQFFDGVQIGR